jgi:hypothetical protein
MNCHPEGGEGSAVSRRSRKTSDLSLSSPLLASSRFAECAQESGAFGIEVHKDIPGRYESFPHPEENLAAIRSWTNSTDYSSSRKGA